MPKSQRAIAASAIQTSRLHRLGLSLAALACLGAAPALAQDDPRPTRLVIAGIVLTYDAARWQAAPGAAGDGYTLTCQVEGCAGAIVDVTTTATTGASYCDLNVALAAARAAFPTLPRVGVNMRTVDNLAVFVADARQADYAPDVGTALYACLDRGGIRYEFVTRMPAGPVPFGYGGSVTYEILDNLRGGPVNADVLVTDHFAFIIPSDVWRPEPADPGSPGIWHLTCLPPTCRGLADVTIVEDPAPPGMTAENCLPPEFDERLGSRDFSYIAAGAITRGWSIGSLGSMCRALTPQVYTACTVSGGVRISISTGFGAGCRTEPVAPPDALRDLLTTIRAVAPNAGAATPITVPAPLAATRLEAAPALTLLPQPAPEPAAATARTVIGTLTLDYDPSRWRILTLGNRVTIGCIAADCVHGGILNLVLDVTVTPSETLCDRDGTYEAVARVHPFTTRQIANLYHVNGFAIFLGWGDAPGTPDGFRAVYACIDHAGQKHEFVARIPADNALPPGLDMTVLALLDGLVPPDPAPQTLDLGGLTLTFDQNAFEVLRAVPEEGSWMLRCLPPTCEETELVGVTAAPVDIVGDCEANLPYSRGSYFNTELFPTAASDPLILTLTNEYSLCRAYTPPARTACVVHDGIRYRLATGFVSGCYFGPQVPEAAFLDLVNGLSLPTP